MTGFYLRRYFFRANYADVVGAVGLPWLLPLGDFG